MLKEDLNTIIKKTKIFSGSAQQISFHLYPKKKIFTVTARSADVGEMSDSVEAAISGEDIDINFNLRYISDCLQSIKSDSVTLYFAGEGKPLIIKGVSDKEFLYMVMPLNK